MGTPGAEGGPGKRAGRKTVTASWPDPTRQGPGAPLGAAGKPEVTKAEVPGGNRMPKKLMPVRRKATGNRDSLTSPPLAVPDNRPDTGLLPGPKGC